MNLQRPARCPSPACQSSLNPGRLHRDGSFFRKSDSKRIQRWRCSSCRRSCSQATGTACFGQNRRRLNPQVFRLLCSGVSQRRTARLLGTTVKTVARKLRFLAGQKKLEHQEFLRRYQADPQTLIQFDEMETHEHSKWKPLSIALMVNPERKVLGFRVCRMPARGKDAHKARAKYGFRPDERPQALHSLFAELRPMLSPHARVISDQKPLYPSILRRHLPACDHVRVEGKRGCIVGQGELKKTGWDPLFNLNHTAAMFRANVNRLFRRTWCTTKDRRRLEDHLWLYVSMHNQLLTPGA